MTPYSPLKKYFKLNIFQGWIFIRKFFSEYGVIYYDSVSDTDEFLIRSHQTAQSAHCAVYQCTSVPPAHG